MFYIIDKRNSFNEYEYTLYDNITDSVLACDAEYIKKLIKHKDIVIKNAHIENDELIINKWYNELATDGTGKLQFTIVAKYADETFKLAGGPGTTLIVNKDKLIGLMNTAIIKNCKCKVNRDIVYKDVMEYKDDNGIRKDIDRQYKLFISKSKLIGLNNSFEYAVENGEVILDTYTGTSKKVVLPNFITAIRKGAFEYKGIESIKLNEGLKYIGSHAFMKCNIIDITIPDSVMFLRHQVFNSNNQLQRINVSNNTLILE